MFIIAQKFPFINRNGNYSAKISGHISTKFDFWSLQAVRAEEIFFYRLYSTGFVSRMTAAKEMSSTSRQIAKIPLPNPVFTRTLYQSLLRKYSSGILPTRRKAMVMNSLNGSYIRYSSSAATIRISESFAMMGFRVLFKPLSSWQEMAASTHS